MASSSAEDNELGKKGEDLSFRLKAGAFLATAAGIGMLGGFGTALAAAKKQDPRHFDAGMVGVDAAASKATTSTRSTLLVSRQTVHKLIRNIFFVNTVEPPSFIIRMRGDYFLCFIMYRVYNRLLTSC